MGGAPRRAGSATSSRAGSSPDSGSPPDAPLGVTLTCIRRTRTHGGYAVQERETAVGEMSVTVAPSDLVSGPTGAAVPVTFAIPADARATDDRDPDDAIVWRLDVRGRVGRVPYAARFEVPVY